MESVKILKHSGQEIFHKELFVAFFFTIYMLKSLFCEDISVEYEFKSEKSKGGIDRLNIKYLEITLSV